MDGRFDGKVVIVTGAAAGIGRAAATRFGREAVSVVAVDLPDTDLGATVELIVRAGSVAIAVTADVSVDADVAAYVQAALDAFGGVDVLFNNAGVVGVVSPLTSYPEDRFDQVIAVNVKGVWLGMKHAAPAIVARGGGSIVNTSFVGGSGRTTRCDRLHRVVTHRARHDQSRGARTRSTTRTRQRRVSRTDRDRGDENTGSRNLITRPRSGPPLDRHRYTHGPLRRTRRSRRHGHVPVLNRRLIPHRRHLPSRRRQPRPVINDQPPPKPTVPTRADVP